MAACLCNARGYQCEVRGPVNQHFHCNKCSLVARHIVLTSCCGEGYCYACIAGFLEKGEPCQACGEAVFTTINPLKYRREIKMLPVYCCMKERGCDWSGTLGELDTHLDPDLDNCLYMDTKCPLHCMVDVPKNRLEQHMAEECNKRDFTCQHCAFKATYEEVVKVHLPECKYVPLKCPNLCGVTCDREHMEDHLKTCRLEDVACEFSVVGCLETPTREDLDAHTQKDMQKHVSLTVKSMSQANQHLKETLANLQDNFNYLQSKIQEQETKIQALELKLTNKVKTEENQEKALNKLNKLFQTQDSHFRAAIQETTEQLKRTELKYEQQQRDFAAIEDRWRCCENLLQKVEKYIFGRRTFVMNNFTMEKMKDKADNWKSPAMYTHPFGYKFCIGIDANGFGPIRGRAIRVELWSMVGEFDSDLKWPAAVTITIEMTNHKGGENAWHTGKNILLNQVTTTTSVFVWERIETEGFIEHSKLEDFLKDDTILFYISECIVH